MIPGTRRVFRPGPTAAFGRIDRLRPGYADAQEAARRHGFEPLLRRVGGHAVVYDHRSVVFEEVTAHDDIAAGIQDRFRRGTQQIVTALESLGLEPRVGELPGEYCAGAFSVSLDGHLKIAGTGQRVVRGAALFSAVVLVGGGDAIRAALTDIYAALELDWDPSTAGAIQDVAPHITPEAVEAALAGVQS